MLPHWVIWEDHSNGDFTNGSHKLYFLRKISDLGRKHDTMTYNAEERGGFKLYELPISFFICE